MSRELILGRIRRSLNRNGTLPGGVERSLAARLEAHTVHVQPAFDEDPVARFAARAEAVQATTANCSSKSGVSRAVVSYLNRNGLAPEIVTAEDELTGSIAWSNTLTVRRGRPDDADQVSVTTAFAGVAETGSVVMLSAPDSPTTLNFMPAVHIVLLRRARIVRHQEDVWALIRAERGAMPRAVNFITGPSRTGDVEQVLQLGAHGPRLLHVVLIGS